MDLDKADPGGANNTYRDPGQQLLIGVIMDEAILSTHHVTPEELDRMYPPPSWANAISGSYGDNERQGWAWDQDGYERNLFFQSGCVIAGMGESCDEDGSHYRCELPTLSVLERDWEWVDDLEQVVSGILANMEAVHAVA